MIEVKIAFWVPIASVKGGFMKGRNAQVARIYKVLNILEGAPLGLSVLDLKSRLQEWGFEVTQRTVYRDLEALRAAGFPLEEKGKSEENGARWTLGRNTKISHYLVLSSRELLALYLARSVLTPLKETPFYEDLASTFSKIEEKIGSKNQAYLQELTQDFKFEPGPRWGLGIAPEIMDTLHAACTERQLVEFSYNSVNSGKSSIRRVGPHFLYFAKGSLYLVGEDMKENKVKIFSLPRIHEAQMLSESYTGETVDPEEYFGSSFGIYHAHTSEKVRILFAPKVAAFIRERRWHASQKVIAKEHGAIELQLEVGMTPELIQWVMGFGAEARVIEPPALIERLQQEAADLLKVYGKVG
jgi:predicted DNA-binding transcriptional regulator YafY